MSAEESKYDGTILVTGATGNIGFAAVRALSAAVGSSATIKAGTRNVEGDKAKALNELAGVTAVKASAADGSLAEEAKGADAVYVVTPGAENRAELAVEIIKVAAAAGVKKIVAVSIPQFEGGTHLFQKQFEKLEKEAREAFEGVTFLRLPFFTDNLYGFAGTVKGMGKIFSSQNPEKDYSSITVADAGAAAVAVLTNDGHAGKTYTLVSSVSTYNKIAAALAAALEKEVVAVQVPDAAAKEAMLGMGFPEWQVDGILELVNLINTDVEAVKSDPGDLETLIGRKGQTIEEWVAGAKPAFV